MSDAGIFFVDNCFQLVTDAGDLKADNGLQTAVIISLFTDRRVTVEELPPGLESLRGYWGDMIPEVEGDQAGSKLWALTRDKITDALLPKVEAETLNALQWMVDDGVAETVTASAERDEFNRLVLSITIQRPLDPRQDQFGFLWDGQEVIADNGV